MAELPKMSVRRRAGREIVVQHIDTDHGPAWKCVGQIADYGVRQAKSVQVVFSSPEVFEAFQRWLQEQGLETFPIPVEDDLPTYGITFGQASNQETRPSAVTPEAPGDSS